MSPRCIDALSTYPTPFIRRAQPLLDIDSDRTATIEEVDVKWDAREPEGWAEESQEATPQWQWGGYLV